MRALRSCMVSTSSSEVRPVCAISRPLEHIGQHADDFTAGGKGRVGERAHQSAAGSAIDQAEAGLADGCAERRSFRAKGGVGSEGRSAKNGHAAKRAGMNES